MPTRMIRDELLTSERYWSVSPEARNLYVSILLSADDCARYTGSNFALRTKCMAGTVAPERVEKLLLELVDVDLVRIYQEEGARFIFVPRFKQRLRFTNSRYPAPPNEINDLTEIKTVSRQSQGSLKTAEEKRREEKKDIGHHFVLPDWVPKEAWASFEDSRKKLRKPLTDRARQLAVAELQRLRDGGHNPIAVIESAVLRGWLSFYPIKDAHTERVKVDA
jgi:hypothetical protein